MPDKERPEGHPEPMSAHTHEHLPPPDTHDVKENRMSGQEGGANVLAQEGDVALVGGEGGVAALVDTQGGTDGDDEAPPKLNQTVELRDIGPCRKHVKVTIPRTDLDDRFEKKFSDLVGESNLPGFRPGKAPRKLIEKKFYKDVADQLKAELLLQSLGQLAEDRKLNPIAQPDLDPYQVEMPREGDLVYEFEIEVAPEFDLPQYKGLRLKRPVREITDAEVQKAQERYLSRFGTLVPKDGAAELGDFISVDVEVSLPGKEPTRFLGMLVRIEPQLSFKDGVIPDFGEKLKGAAAGQTRKVDIALTASASDPNLRGRSVPATFHIREVKSLRLPELDEHFLDTIGLNRPEQLTEKVRVALQAKLLFEQREAARRQVLEHIAAAADWDLPRDLLRRQAARTLARKRMEMESAGLPEHEIKARLQTLQHDVLAATARSLKEQFVLQRIADAEKIEVDDDDVAYEIELIAAQTGEPARRVRARIEKEQLRETLMTEILERKALDVILDHAEYEDVPMEAEGPATAIVEQQAIPGEEPEEEKAEGEAENQLQAGVGGT